MFWCLVMCISLVTITIFTPGLAIFYLATNLKPNHVRGVKWSRVWRKCRFEHSIGRGSTLVPGCWSAVSRLLLHHHT
jgi:hypothetical protein